MASALRGCAVLLPTGRVPMHAGAAANRSNEYRSENGQRRPLSSICTGVGRRPSPTPSAAPERLGVNAVDIRTRACAWPSVTGAPRVAANASPMRAIHSPLALAADFCSDLLRRLRAAASSWSKQTADSATTAPFRRERKPLRPIPDLIGLFRAVRAATRWSSVAPPQRPNSAGRARSIEPRASTEPVRASKHRMRTFGDEQVAPVSVQDTCFAAVAVLGSERRETIEIVPFRYDAAGANGSRFAIADAEVAPKALSTSGHARRFRSRVEAAIWGPHCPARARDSPNSAARLETGSAPPSWGSGSQGVLATGFEHTEQAVWSRRPCRRVASAAATSRARIA